MIFNADVSFEPVVFNLAFKKEVIRDITEGKISSVMGEIFEIPGEARLPNDVVVYIPFAPVFSHKIIWKDEKNISVEFTMNLDGARKAAYLYLKALSEEAGKDPKKMPKKMPKSVRLAAKILSRLSPEPTGNVSFDKPRQIIIDTTIQQFKGGLRQQLTHKVNRGLESWAESESAVLL